TIIHGIGGPDKNLVLSYPNRKADGVGRSIYPVTPCWGSGHQSARRPQADWKYAQARNACSFDLHARIGAERLPRSVCGGKAKRMGTRSLDSAQCEGGLRTRPFEICGLCGE